MRVRFGRCVFDSQSRELTRDGQPLPLSPKAFVLLEALIVAAPAAVTKEALYDRLWPKTFVEPGNLHNLVSEIRAALADDDHALVRTIHRIGYAFRGETCCDDPHRFAIVIGGEEIALQERATIVGRDPAADVVLDVPDVSRQHARFMRHGERVTLEDLGSKNGTFVGSIRIEGPTAVTEADEICIGRTHVRLRCITTPKTTATSS